MQIETHRAALTRLLEAIADVGAAGQIDHEQGVAWMNDEASAKFVRENPVLMARSAVMHERAREVAELFGVEV